MNATTASRSRSLTDDEKKAVAQRYREGKILATIAEEFGVSRGVVANAVRAAGATAPKNRVNAPGGGRPSKISDEQKKYLQARIDNGDKISALALELGVSVSAIYKRLELKRRKLATKRVIVPLDEQRAIKDKFHSKTMSVRELAAEYGRSIPTIRRVVGRAKDSGY